MNFRFVLRLLSVIVATLVLAFLGSFLVGVVFFNEWSSSHLRQGWLISLCFASAVALLLFFCGSREDTTFFRKEALATIGLGWIVASLVGAVPYFCLLDGCTLDEAIFESTSGLTTTGASTFAYLDAFPKSLMFWRCMSQWIGGLGVVVFFVAILGFLGAGAKMLYSNEASLQSSDLNTARVQEGVKRIMLVYACMSLTCLIALLLCGLDPYEATCHMFTTVSTGGFSTEPGSFGDFNNPAAEWVVITFMLLCGINFILLIRFLSGDVYTLRHNSELKAYLGIPLVGTVLIALMLSVEMQAESYWDAFRIAAFQVVSIMTTAGFTTTDYSEWLPVGRILLLLLMVIGGCAGSTSGGIKVIRLVIAIKMCFLTIEKSFRSHVVRTLSINGRILDRDEQEGVMVFVMMNAVLILVATLLLALFEHQMSFPGVVSAIFASIFNIGPGLAEVGPAQVYSFLTPQSKLLLSLLMIMGRLELYAVLALFAPSLWRRFS